MGGGIVEKTNLGYEQTVTTNELRSYDMATGAEKHTPTCPSAVRAHAGTAYP